MNRYDVGGILNEEAYLNMLEWVEIASQAAETGQHTFIGIGAPLEEMEPALKELEEQGFITHLNELGEGEYNITIYNLFDPYKLLHNSEISFGLMTDPFKYSGQGISFRQSEYGIETYTY